MKTFRSYSFAQSAIVMTLLLTGCASEVGTPTADAGSDQSDVAVGVPVQLDGSKSDDPGDRTLSYSWKIVEAPAGSHVDLLGPTTEKPSFLPDKTGVYKAALIVSNGVHDSAMDVVEIEAGSCGTNVPVVDALVASPADGDIGTPVALSAEVSDADNETGCDMGRTMTYAWSLAKLPEGSQAQILSPGAAEPSFIPDVAGDYEVRLIVTDNLGRSSVAGTASLTVGSCGSQAPKISKVEASTTAPNVGDTVQMSATASDADKSCGNPVLSYGWSITSLPEGSHALLNSTSAENPTLVADVAGDYVIDLVVTDETGRASAPKSLTITAAACGDAFPVAEISQMVPPAGTTVNDQGMNLVRPGDTVQLSAVDSADADNGAGCGAAQTLSYWWSFVNLPAGSNASLNDPRVMDPSFSADAIGTYVLSLVVTDSTGRASAPMLYTVVADPVVGIMVPAAFTIQTVAAGGALDSPQGLTVDDDGNVVFVDTGNDSVMSISPSGAISTLARNSDTARGADIVWDTTAQAFFATTGTWQNNNNSGNGQLIRIAPGGQISTCSQGEYLGVALHTDVSNVRHLYVADRNNDRVRAFDPDDCTTTSTSTDFNGNLDRPWGVAAATVSSTDNLITSNDGGNDIWRLVGSTSTRISNGNLDNPRDVVFLPCAAPKILVAEEGQGEVRIMDNTQNATESTLIRYLESPVGLHFEDANNLLVSDPGAHAIFRITGDFCGL